MERLNENKMVHLDRMYGKIDDTEECFIRKESIQYGLKKGEI